MLGLSSAAHRVSPPVIEIPRAYNAAHDLIERNLRAGRGAKLAYIDDQGRYTYEELAQRVNRCANTLVGLGIQPEQRVLLCLQDTIDFPTAFLGAIKAGLYGLAVIGVLASVVGAYYYLLIVKTMYFDEPAKGFGPMPAELKAVLGVSGLFNLLFVLYPGPLVEAATAAAKSLF